MSSDPNAKALRAPPLLRRTTSLRKPGILVHPQTTTNYQSAINSLSLPAQEEDRTRLTAILEEGIKFAVSKADGGLLSWMAELSGETGATLSGLVHQTVDEDGYDLVCMSIIASASTTREEKEDLVRFIVRKWGLPPTSLSTRSSTELPSSPSFTRSPSNTRASWTPLHLASLLSTSPLVSFLLTQGASPFVTTARNLTPLDLIADMENRQDVAVLLQHAMDAVDEDRSADALLDRSAGLPGFSPFGDTPSETGDTGAVEDPTRSNPRAAVLMQRFRANKFLALQVEHRRNRKRSERDAQDAFIVDRMKRCLGLGMDQGVQYLLHAYQSGGKRPEGLTVEEEMAVEDEEAEEDGIPDRNGGSYAEQLGESALDDLYGGEGEQKEPTAGDDASFLVWPLDKLDTFLDIIITTYPPQRYPLERRALPANALYLLSRFAVYRGGDGWLSTILEQATLTIEQVCLANAQDVFGLTFWIYNVTILLYLIESDPVVEEACEASDLKVMLREMLIALQIHIMRFAEERIDRILETTLLDFEASGDNADVQFTDEWTFLRGLTGKSKKRATNPHVASLFGGNPDDPTTPPRRVPSEAGSPMTRDLSIRASLLNLRADVAASPSASIRSLAAVVGGGMEAAPTPLDIVDILYGTHLVLQLYQINPALIIQIFSQIMLWISSEVFNRVLAGGKKLLCRSKASNVKQNLAVLEEWVKQSGLPPSIYTKHFERCLQLLEWLQCSSQLKEMDMLIAATQHLKALNPLQLRRSLRDYRYELNEPKMSEDCVQYLSQLQRDWERQRVKRGVDAIQRQVDARRLGRASSDFVQDPADEEATRSSPIDSLFDPDLSLAAYNPPMAPACLGEMQDSRYMLPPDLPSFRFLPAVPHEHTDWNYPSTDPEKNSRPSSETSMPAKFALPFTIIRDDKLRRIPDEFLEVLRQADRLSETRRWVSNAKPESIVIPTSPIAPLQPSHARPAPPVLADSSVHNLRHPAPLLPPFGVQQEPVSPSPASSSRRASKPISPTTPQGNPTRSWWPKMRSASEVSKSGSEEGSMGDVDGRSLGDWAEARIGRGPSGQ